MRTLHTADSATRVMRMALMAGLAIGVAALSACERRSEGTKSIERSSSKMEALAGVNEAAPASASSRSLYTEVSTDLQGLAKGDNKSDKSAAALLVSQSQSGLAAQAAMQAAAIENALRNQSIAMRGLVSQWVWYNAVAAAAESFNPAAELTRIASERTAKDALIVDSQRQLAELQRRLSDLQQQSKAKMDAATALQTQYAAELQRTIPMSATDAAPVVAAAEKVRREADAVRLEGQRIAAQASTVAPLLPEVEAVISQLTNQRRDLDASEQQLKASAQANAQEATQARAAAAKTANDLDTMVVEFAKTRQAASEGVMAAAEQYSKAAQSAQQAQGESPASARLAVADAQQAMGELHWQHAQNLATYAQVMQNMASMTPALPNSSDYAAKASGANKDRVGALAAAGAALEAAQSAYAGVPVRGAAKERLTAVAERLGALSARLSGKSMDAPAGGDVEGQTAPAPDAEGAPEAAAPASGGDVDAVRGLVDSMKALASANNYEGIGDLFYAPTPEAQAAMKTVMGLGGKTARVDAACQAKFGKSLADVLMELPGGMGAMVAQQMKAGAGTMDAKALAAVDSAGIAVAVAGERATATGGGLTQTLHFIRSNGAWKFTDPQLEAAMPQLPMMAAMMGPLGTALDGYAADVEAGKFADTAAAAQGFMAVLQQMGAPGGG